MMGVGFIMEPEFLAMVNGRKERLVGIRRVVWRTGSVSRQQDGFHLWVGEINARKRLDGGFVSGGEVV